MIRVRVARLALHVLCALGAPLLAAPAAFALTSVQVGSGLTAPVFLTAPTGDSRLFVVEQGGLIKILGPQGTSSTYLDISARIDASGEQGLLGLAFDPGFSGNGRFYVNYIDRSTKDTVVSMFTAPSAGSTTADSGSEVRILTIDQPAGRTNHKAGWIGFRGSDPGRLYIATGDGGSGNDPDNNAQNLGTNLGKILRITPTPDAVTKYSVPADNPFVGIAGNDEIWAYGLRNPYRNSFDSGTGNFWIADVGQSTREEINFEAATFVAGGRNYGWRPLEGSGDNPGVSDPAPANATPPIHDYGRSVGGTVIGGYVYRGGGEAGLDGSYFFGDFVSGRIFSMAGGNPALITDRTTELGSLYDPFQLTSFGEDGVGNLYAMGLDGTVWRIAAAVAPVPEPGTWAMLIGGLAVLGAAVRRRTRAGLSPAACPGSPRSPG